MIFPPLCSFHCQTRFSNSSRPRSSFFLPSLPSCRSTTIWVAIPAWSSPGSHRVSNPLMRFQRTMTSCSVRVKAWPMCSDPVTFGGGITIAKAGLSDAGSARKNPLSSQKAYQRRSTSLGS